MSEIIFKSEVKSWEMTQDEIDEIIKCFLPRDKDISIDLSKFDYRTHTAEWYKHKFPKFPDHVYPILEECSVKKIGVGEKDEPSGGTREEGEFVVSFNEKLSVSKDKEE